MGVPLQYARPLTLSLWNRAAWWVVAFVSALSIPPIYVFIFEWVRLRNNPYAYPLAWGERQSDDVVVLFIGAAIVRPIVAVACLLILSDKKLEPRPAHLYIISILICMAVTFFEFASGLWSKFQD